MKIAEGTKGALEFTNNILLYGLNPLGYGAQWEATMWPKRIDEEIKLRNEQKMEQLRGSINNWFRIATMHEIVHAVGGKHLFEQANFWRDFNKGTNSFSQLLDEHPKSLMRPIGSFDWLNDDYIIEKETKKQFLNGFGLK